MAYYTYFKKETGGKGHSVVFTNLQTLSDYDSDSLNYNTLVTWFSRKKNTWYEDVYNGVIVIKSFKLVRGGQRVKGVVKGDGSNFR